MNDDPAIIWRSAPALHICVNEQGNDADGQGTSSQLWDQYLSDHPQAWNGPLLQLVHADENQLVACVSDYRTYVESRASELVHDKVFLAVTGVLFNESGFLIGLRSGRVDDPGTWEFAPAGGLEAFPVEDQLHREILEELNLNVSDLMVGAPIGMYVNQEEGVADLVVPVRVLASWPDVKKRFRPGEYERLEILRLGSLVNIADSNCCINGLFRCIVQWLQDGIIKY